MSTPPKAHELHALHALAASVAEGMEVITRELSLSAGVQSFPRAVEDAGTEAPLGRVIPFPKRPGAEA